MFSCCLQFCYIDYDAVILCKSKVHSMIEECVVFPIVLSCTGLQKP